MEFPQAAEEVDRWKIIEGNCDTYGNMENGPRNVPIWNLIWV